MEEAKFSINIRFNFRGFDTQFTSRTDESGAKLLEIFPAIVDHLEKLGATPARRWEEVKNGNGQPKKAAQPELVEQPVLECPVHHKAEPSTKNGHLYCPSKLDDGSWCKWNAGK